MYCTRYCTVFVRETLDILLMPERARERGGAVSSISFWVENRRRRSLRNPWWKRDEGERNDR